VVEKEVEVSSISGIGHGASSNVLTHLTAQRAAPSVAVSTTKDSDGDFDGTKVGQSDAKDFGKGSRLDVRA
jgi:hypothetical protein